MTEAAPEPAAPPGIDLDHPSVARVYDYFLGGTANWAIDREFGARMLASFPLLRPIAVANRRFLHRVVTRLARLGIRQFVDIGAGVPTMGNTHAVADAVAPDARVVYVDHDPIAVAHSRVLLEDRGDLRRHAAIMADLRMPDQLWSQVGDTGVIDLNEPVGLLLVAVLHVRQPGPGGADIGAESVTRYRELLARGSYLAISHGTEDGVDPAIRSGLADIRRGYELEGTPLIFRSRAEVRELFGDFDLVPPGIDWVTRWHPEDTPLNSHPLSVVGSPAPSLSAFAAVDGDVDLSAPNESAVLVGLGRKP